MKAAVLTGKRAMEIVDVTDPLIENDTDVLLKVEQVGVCGSDVHYYVEGNIGSQVVVYPYRVGHEMAGVVEDVGEAVTRVKRGDRVAVEPAMSCGECDQCSVGRPHTCRKLLFLGCPGQVEGCLSEYIVMPEECCYPIGPDLSLEQAALCEPLSIGSYGVELSGAKKGDAIGILGAGPIGLSVLAFALGKGIERLYVTDKIDYRLDAARSAGAAWGGNPDSEDVVLTVQEKEPNGLDVVFECCGQQEALDQSIEMLKPGGKLMLLGIPRADRVSFSIDSLRRKEICVQNVRRQNGQMQPAIDAIASGKVNVDFMLTHRFPFARSKEAFDLVDSYADGVIKAMIGVGEGEGKG
jgi:L-iditol 2-dehydrogenase